jgi:predicted exporter/SAM-dependent methyltransferase
LNRATPESEGTKAVNWILLLATLLITAAMLGFSLMRLHVDTDVVSALPDDGGAVSEAVDIFKHHPFQDQIAIDIGLPAPDPDRLVSLGDVVEKRLHESGLFASVGVDAFQNGLPALVDRIVTDLPYLFSEKTLETRVLPLIRPPAVQDRVRFIHDQLTRLDGIGQAGMIAKDPLGLRELKLSGLVDLAPTQDARIYRGKLLSGDSRHLLVVARPLESGTNTVNARNLDRLMDAIEKRLIADGDIGGHDVTLTPVGAFRAALDNETIVRKDVRNALILATLGIAGMLIVAFPRPWLGLLALLPAAVGTVAALFVTSLFTESLSIMALGFGGAIVSITVDHGIAYLLFLDQPQGGDGRKASREVWAVGLLAALTSMGAFAVLGISGFPVFEQLGWFTAMGIGFSFLFVHTVFPLMFPRMPPVTAARVLPLRGWVDRMAGAGDAGAWLCLGLAVFLAFWMRPRFLVDLKAMGTVTDATLAADQLITEVWGDMFNRVFIMTEADTLPSLREKNDQLLDIVEAARAKDQVTSGFLSSDIFPGAGRRKANLAAWRVFWSPDRVEDLRLELNRAGDRFGFSSDAFSPFFETLSGGESGDDPAEIPPETLDLMGIVRDPVEGEWRQFTGLGTGPGFSADAFRESLAQTAKIFDPQLFSEQMGRLLFDTFTRMLFILGISVVVLLFFFFVDWRLTLVSLLPIAFSLVCTLGTLGLMGRPLDIPSLMLAIIVLGLGIDYSLFWVRSYQRYQARSHEHFTLIRMAVFMASASTLIGFGVLLTAEHALLKSAGITSFLAIAYSLAGAFFILPPILDRRFGDRPPAPSAIEAGIRYRYRNMEAYPRLFARFKLRLDPMFKELDRLLEAGHPMKTIVDIGTGYGVPASWLLNRFPDARVYGIEPSADRVRVASRALGPRGAIQQGAAPVVPEPPEVADGVFMLDMSHYLTDEDLDLTLETVGRRLKPGGILVMRMVTPPIRRFPWSWWIEDLKARIGGTGCRYRRPEEMVERMGRHGFNVTAVQPSGSSKELVWVVAGRKLDTS